MYFTSTDGSQNMFETNTWYIRIKKKEKGTDYVHSWKPNAAYNSKLKPLYAAILHSTKLTGYKIGIKFDKDPLAVDQNNYLTKVVNTYIAYDLAAWLRYSTNNFKFKNC